LTRRRLQTIRPVKAAPASTEANDAVEASTTACRKTEMKTKADSR
jgi:hypothetical protein